MSYQLNRNQLEEIQGKWDAYLKRQEEELKTLADDVSSYESPFVVPDYVQGEERYWAYQKEKDKQIRLNESHTSKLIEPIPNKEKASDSDPDNDGRIYSDQDLENLIELRKEVIEMENQLSKADAEGSSLDSLKKKLDTTLEKYNALSTKISGGEGKKL